MKALTPTCAHCGAPLTGVRFGVRLRPLWVRIVDAIVRAGPDGIFRADLVPLIYGDAEVTANVISVHVNDINAALASTDYRIAGGTGRPYRITHSVESAA